MHRDEAGRIRYHFVIADYLCRPVGGALGAGDDAADAAWVARDALAALRGQRPRAAVITAAFATAGRAGGHGR